MVFNEILQAAYQLMTDVFGNYVIQKFFEVRIHAYLYIHPSSCCILDIKKSSESWLKSFSYKKDNKPGIRYLQIIYLVNILSRIYNKLLKVNNKKTTQMTNGQKTCADISLCKIIQKAK